MKRTPLKRGNKPIPKRRAGKINTNKEDSEKMFSFFLSIWEKRPHYSEISGKWLGDEPSSAFFHHLWPKEPYPQFKFSEDNILLVTLEEHDQIHINEDYYPVVKEKKDEFMFNVELFIKARRFS